jgi:hypothetical protein|tara:strand:+ start:77 stop:685 length:609 start_codon:yes stop_codon:yes gene_type:complete
MGYLSDFSNFDESLVDVKLHEETILKNEIQDDTNFSQFEPIVLSLYPDKKINSKVINFETDELILLDGHHRWKYANRTDSVNKLKCILVNFDDIKIKSYFFRLNVKKEEFENLLIQEGFEEIENKSLGIKFNDTYYSNPNHENISQLYKFKKTLQDSETITPILDDSEETNDFLSFTPITPNDLLYISELLPPKSTWITPRI